MNPSASVQFSNFNSYFELLVAFTFAYASLKGFKDYINRVSLRDYDTFYTQKLEEILSAIQTVAGPQTKAVIEKADLKQTREKIATIEKICQGFYNGTFLQPMFFLAGLEYLFFLFLGGFQSHFGTLTIYLTVCFVFFSTLIYYLYVLVRLRQHSLQQIPPDNKKWLTSSVVLSFFGLVNFGFLFGAAYLSTVIHSQKWPLFQDGDCFRDFFFSCSYKRLWESIGVAMAFSISIVPYLIYFYRHKLFISHLEKIFDLQKEQTERELEGMVYKMIKQLSIIKPDDKNDER